ncbi:MAG: hypothetical protein E7513_03665 [Ruminococcaceae bacterium]|nr:hypothetical protein [Oscillospiraceae bacterium]
MKKLISLILVVIFISTVFVGCGEKEATPTESIATESVTEATEVSTDAPTEKPTQAPTVAPTEKPTQAPKKEETWKLLYKERINAYISEANNKNEVEFSLVLIDDDSIPELVIGGPSHITAATLCWVYDGSLNENAMGYTISEGFTYIERSGLIKICSQWQGSGSDTIYDLMQGRLIEIVSGTFSTMNNSYTWNGESVPAMDYDYMLNDVFSEENAKNVAETVYDYDSIFSVIDSY